MQTLYWRISNNLLFCLIFLLPGIVVSANSDGYSIWREDSQIGEPLFRLMEFQRLSTTPDVIRLDIYAPIKYDMLQFVRHDSLFVAAVDMNLSVSGDKGSLLERKIKYFGTTTSEYIKTNSRSDYLIGTFSLDLPPGKYTLSMLITDRESKRTSRVEKKVELKLPQTDQIGVSGLMLTTSRLLDVELNTPVNPVVNPNEIDCHAEIFCFFDIFRSNPQKEMNLELSVLNDQEEVQNIDTLTIFGGERLASYFMSVDCSELIFGKYSVRLIADYCETKQESRCKFTRNSSGLPGSIADLDKAIQQLSIIASRDEMQELLAFPKSEREKKLVEFWDKIFPTPGEDTNGKMKEFYRRINYVNQQFGDGREGWGTDRGRVYLVYGRPTDMEKQVFVDQQAPTEIWYYSHLGKQFVFRDENGFGDFRLVSPFW